MQKRDKKKDIKKKITVKHFLFFSNVVFLFIRDIFRMRKSLQVRLVLETPVVLGNFRSY